MGDAHGRTPMLLLVSCGSHQEAARIARALVEGRIAACVHIKPHGSIYRWKGSVEEAAEYGLLIKTTSDRTASAETLIRALHGYDLPAILAIPAEAAADCRRWLEDETDHTGDAATHEQNGSVD